MLYLNHGGGDDDSKWTNTDPRQGGHAQFILDNLIAAGKARPMIVVMPNTRGIASPNPPKPGEDDAVTQEYLKDIIPYVEGHYHEAGPGEPGPGRAVDGRVRRDEHRPVAPRHLRRALRLQLGLLRRPGEGVRGDFKEVLSNPKTNEELLRCRSTWPRARRTSR